MEVFKRGERRAEIKVYDEPWATKPRIRRVHIGNEDNFGRTCFDKLFDTGWSDFGYFECETCGRLVARRCGYNGWRSYVHTREDGGEICMKCYQEELLEEGTSAESFEAGIPGDFFARDTLVDCGYSPVPGIEHFFVHNEETRGRVCRMALDLISRGRKVVADYDSMAYGGGEGFITLWSRKGEI
jgi:hypothetical protein